MINYKINGTENKCFAFREARIIVFVTLRESLSNSTTLKEGKLTKINVQA